MRLGSVCATAVAGVVAVGAAVVLVHNLPLESMFNSAVPLAEHPGFTAPAAVEG